MKNTYLHYVSWSNTKGNHAGMGYLCEYLGRKDKSVRLKEFRLSTLKGGRYINFITSILDIVYFSFNLKSGDTIFFMEYLTKGSAYQEITATMISKLRPDVRIMGMIHLTGKGLMQSYPKQDALKKYMNVLDKIWVLGSSLKEFIVGLGINPNKVMQTFHYVDVNYYHPANIKTKDTSNVLVQGNQLRDYNMLRQIILKCPELNFIIMQGVKDLRYLFYDLKNVSLIGFVTENELLNIMQNCDVALSVMEDTIGSNVVTTSMACGLAMVVSDVGSIRDYCDNSNSIFCKDLDDFLAALNHLNRHRDKCELMKKKSRTKALNFRIENFLEVFMRETSN